MDFVLEVYGDAEYVIMAMETVAAIFRSSDYRTLLMIFVIVGLFTAVVGFLYRIDRGFVSVQMLLFFFVGATILVSVCTIPTSKVIVHDMVKNNFKQVSGVPTVMAYIAYTMNQIETGLNGIIAGAAGPINDPVIMGKGEGLEIVSNFEKIPYLARQYDANLIENLRTYMDRCVALERGLNKITPDMLNRPGINSLWDGMRSQNLVIGMKYNVGDGTTLGMTCDAAYKQITIDLGLMVAPVMQIYCQEMGFEAVNQRATCSSTADTIVSTYIFPSGGVTAHDVVKNIVVADTYVYMTAMRAGQNPQAFGADQAYYKTIGGQYQMALAAGKQIPAMMGMYRAIMLSIFPLILLFAFIAPKKTIMWYLGGNMMIVIWSALDTLLLSYYLQMLDRVYADIKHSGLGVQQLLSMPSKSMQIMTQFGSARWAAMGLASAMVVGILGLSGHAMANIASGSAAGAESNARAVGGQYSGGAGEGQAMKDSQRMLEDKFAGEGLKAISNPNDPMGLSARGDLAQGTAHKNIQDMGADAAYGTSQYRTHGGNLNAGDARGLANSIRTEESNARAFAVGMGNAANVGTHGGEGAVSAAQADSQKANFLGISRQGLLENQKLNNGNLVLNEQMVKNLERNGIKANAGDTVTSLQLDGNGNMRQMQTTNSGGGITTAKTYGADGRVSQWSETGNANGLEHKATRDSNGNLISKELSGVLTDKNIESVRSEMRAAGYDNVADDLKVGDKFRGTYGVDGLSTASVDRGGQRISYDLSKSTVGYDKQNIYKDTTTLDHGTNYTPSNLVQAITKGDSAEFARLSSVHADMKQGEADLKAGKISQAEYDKKQNAWTAERNAFSEALAKGIGTNYSNDEVNRWGTSLGAGISARGGVGLPDFSPLKGSVSIDGKAEINRQDTSQSTTNSVYNDLNKMIDGAFDSGNGTILEGALQDSTRELMNADNRGMNAFANRNPGSGSVGHHNMPSMTEVKEMMPSAPSVTDAKDMLKK